MDTTYDQARRCPKCNELGKEVGRRAGPRGSTFHTIRCENDRCSWSGTTYLVQVMADGSVAEPTTDRQKSFPEHPTLTTERAEQQALRMLERSLGNGGEVPNR